MKTFEKIHHGQTLSEPEAYRLLLEICEGALNPPQIAAVIAFYTKKPVSVNELKGFRNALLDLCRPVTLEQECLDVCGTGGDQKNTFNISTLSAFVIAAAGAPVAKHGNYGSSSVSGSSDIMKHFGYTFKEASDALNDELNKHRLCFIHAPLFHPALKTVAAIRKDLGIRTFFNLLGPLVNPAQPKYRYIGVYSADTARLYNYILQKENAEYVIVNSFDGYDEVSLTAPFRCISKNREATVEPFDLGFARLKPDTIYGGATLEEAARIFTDVLQNSCTEAQKNVVLVNSALALQCYTKSTFAESLARCRESLESKKALELFKTLIKN